MQDYIPPEWTPSQLYGLAPDRFLLKNGRDLIHAPQWAQLHRENDLIWGHYQRTKSNLPPFRTAIRLSDLKTYCTCGSLKTPCKFTLALLLRHKQEPQAFTTTAHKPGWVTAWQKELENQPPNSYKPFAPETKTQVASGMSELALWLRDLIHNGLGELPHKAKSVFDPMVHRLHDAHTAEIAFSLKNLQQAWLPPKKKPKNGWEEQTLRQFGKLYLLTQAWHRYDQLSAAEQGDLRIAVGQICGRPTQPEQITDHWHVLGKRVEVKGNQTLRRVWLHGQNSGRTALITISERKQRQIQHWPTDSLIQGTAHFYQTTAGHHAEFDAQQITLDQPQPSHTKLNTFNQIPAAQHRFRQQQIHNPWLKQWPIQFYNIYIRHHHAQWWLVDQTGSAIKLKAGTRHDWLLLSHNGGRPITLFGELLSDQYEPLSLKDPLTGRWLDLSAWGFA